MMKCLRLSAIATLLMFFGCCTPHVENNKHTITLSDDVEVFQLAEGIWLHTTYYELPHLGRYPANGIIVISGNDSLMIDLPWTNGQAGILFDWIENTHKATVRAVVPTHSHTDCAGGLAEAHKRGADSWAYVKTIEKLEEGKGTVPKNGFAETRRLECGDTIVELAYLGGGHTTDNIVAWIPSRNVLFGGCLVKSLDARTLGNTREADLDDYPKTLKMVLQEYAGATVIVPGHGKHGSLQLIKHTIELCENKD